MSFKWPWMNRARVTKALYDSQIDLSSCHTKCAMLEEKVTQVQGSLKDERSTLRHQADELRYWKTVADGLQTEIERTEKRAEKALADKQRTTDSLIATIRDQSMALMNGPEDAARRARTVAQELEGETGEDETDTKDLDAYAEDEARYLDATPAEPWEGLEVVWMPHPTKETDGAL